MACWRRISRSCLQLRGYVWAGVCLWLLFVLLQHLPCVDEAECQLQNQHVHDACGLFFCWQCCWPMVLAVQDVLELTPAEISARVPAAKPAAKLVKAVQHLQRTWLQVMYFSCRLANVGCLVFMCTEHTGVLLWEYIVYMQANIVMRTHCACCAVLMNTPCIHVLMHALLTQVTPSGPQPLSSSNSGTKVTILRGAASGVISVPIDTAKPSDSIKASWGPSDETPYAQAGPSQFERNARVPIPSSLEAKVAAERAVTEALAKDMCWYQTIIDNPLAGSKSLEG